MCWDRSGGAGACIGAGGGAENRVLGFFGFGGRKGLLILGELTDYMGDAGGFALGWVRALVYELRGGE